MPSIFRAPIIYSRELNVHCDGFGDKAKILGSPKAYGLA